ncbi:MAG: hypothetical protein ACPGXK_04260, partial [Phycisphaerae bacterium]
MRKFVPRMFVVIIPALLFVPACSSDLDPSSSSKLPTVVAARSMDANTIEVEFSQPVGVEAEDEANYRVTNSKSEILDIQRVRVSEDRLAAELTTDDQVDTEAYSLSLGSEPSVPVSSFILPRVVGAVSLDYTTVKVTFTTQMGSSASDASNYFITQESQNEEAGRIEVL